MTYPAITIDKDVPMDGTFPPEITSYMPVLKMMGVGDSFFLAGFHMEEAAGIVTYARHLQIPVEPRHVECDSVYFRAGIRVWRVADVTSSTGSDVAPADVTSATRSEANTPAATLTQPGDDKRKFYVIESESGSHFTWGSSLPLAEQKLSEDRQKIVRKITHQQFMDLEAKNFTMHYWVNPEERRYFFICSALNTNAGFNQVGCEEVDYDAYLRFKHLVDAGFGLSDGKQYVRNLKTGDMQVIDITGWTNDQLKLAVGRYEPVSQEAYNEWIAENEL